MRNNKNPDARFAEAFEKAGFETMFVYWPFMKDFPSIPWRTI